MRGRCERSDGNIHTDHWSKVVTVLIYPNEQWADAGGRLRLLRSADDLEDYAAEVSPIDGTLLAFRRSDRSYHGHARFDGERRIIQISWLRRSPFARSMQWLARRRTHWMKRLGLHPEE